MQNISCQAMPIQLLLRDECNAPGTDPMNNNNDVMHAVTSSSFALQSFFRVILKQDTKNIN